MNRLQVGDERYVRNGAGELFKAAVTHIGKAGITVLISKLGVTQILWRGIEFYHNNECKHFWSLVYPFPCVKELAV